MIVRALIRFSAAALVLVCIGVSGCSEGSDRIFTPPADESNDQLSTGFETEYVDGTPGDNDGYPIFDDPSGDSQDDDNDGWMDKYGQDIDEGSGGGFTKPRDFRPRED